MIINNNVPALVALNSLNKTVSEMNKSLQKLSLGLRITKAADDAAGIAISEKMRAQIKGLDMAARNAQDGISMMQTAEGALQEATSLLHRMRELAVQAANDTLTQQDRGYIQLEIDQLRSELDKIASTTQFNRKKLLDGSSDVLWSSSDMAMRAIVRGGIKKEEEGNFKISAQTLATGNAEIKKSNIFEAYIEPMVIDGRVIGMGYSTVNINTTKTENIRNIDPGIQGAGKGTYATAYAGTGTCGHVFQLASPTGNLQVGTYRYDFPDPPGGNGAAHPDNLLPTIRKITSYGMGIDDLGIADDPASMFADPWNIPNTNLVFEAVAINHVEQSVTFKVISRRFDIYANSLPDIESYITIGKNGITGGVVGSGVVQIHQEGIYSVGVFDALGIDLLPDKLRLNKDYDKFNVGDSIFINITPPLGNPAGANNYPRLSLSITGPGGTVLNYIFDRSFQTGDLGIPFLNIDSSNGDIYNATFHTRFTSLPYPHSGLYRSFSVLNDGTNDTRTVNINTSMEIVYNFGRQYRTLGETYKNVLPTTFPQSLTLNQGGLSATIVLYESDTFYDFAEKLNYAIAFQLENAKYVLNSMSEFAVVADGKTNSPESVGIFAPTETGYIWSYGSTIVVRSAKPGEDGKIHFTGDEEFIKALGLNVIQESQESIFSLSVSDAHDGTIFASGVKVSGNTAYGVVNENIDLIFDPMKSIEVYWNEEAKRFDFRAKTTSIDEFLHLASNATVLQIGANEKEDLQISFGDISSRSLGLSDILLLNNKLSERAITRIDRAIDKVSSIRARLGAFQNRLEHTITNLSVASENLMSSESRIRDLDIAKEALNLAKLTIIVNTGNSMLTQANQLPEGVLSLLR